MADSANLAVYMIVLQRGLASQEQLDQAMVRAVEREQPLERVLVEAGSLSPQQVVDVRGERARMGRRCGACTRITFVLTPEDGQKPTCEYCDQPLEARKPKRRPSAAPPPAKRDPETHSGRHTRTARMAIDRRMGDLREEMRELVSKAIDNRMAQVDLDGLTRRAAKAALSKMRQSLPEELRKLGAGGGEGADVESVTAAALAQVAERVETADLSGMFDKVAAGAEALLRERGLAGEPARDDALAQRVESLEDLAATQSGLGERVRALEDTTPLASGGADADLAARVRALEDRASQSAPDEGLLERVQALEDRSLANAPDPTAASEVLERLQALEGRPLAQPTDDLLARLEALEATGGAATEADSLRERLEALEQRVAEAPASAAFDSSPLEARLAELEAERTGDRIDELADALSQASMQLDERVSAIAEHAGRPDAAVLERLAELEHVASRAIESEDLARVVERVAELEEAKPDGDAEEALLTRAEAVLSGRAGELVAEALAEQLDRKALAAEVAHSAGERLEGRMERAAEKLRQPVLEAIEQRIASLDLKTLPERVSAEARASLGLDELVARTAGWDERLRSLEGLGARLEHIESRPAGDPEVAHRLAALESASLSDRLVELEARMVSDPGLADRIVRLEQRPIADPATSERLALLEIRPLGDPEQAERVERLEADLAQRMAELEARAGAPDAALEARLAELEARPTGDPRIVERIAQLDARAESTAIGVNDRLATLEANAGRTSPVEHLVERLAGRLAQLESGVGPEDANVVEALSTRVAELEASQASAGSDLVEGLVARLAELEASHQAQLSSAPSGPTDRDLVAALSERVAQLEASAGADYPSEPLAEQLAERVAQLEAGAGGSQPSAGAAEGASSAELSELAQRVAELEAQPSGAAGPADGETSERVLPRVRDLEEQLQQLLRGRIKDLEAQVFTSVSSAEFKVLEDRQDLFEARLGASAEGAPVGEASAGAPRDSATADELSRLRERLERLEEELEDDGGFSEAELIVQNTMATVEERLRDALSDERLAEAVRQHAPAASSGTRSETSEPESGKTSVYDRRFLQLANKVRDLDEAVSKLSVQEATIAGKSEVSNDLVGLLNSAEFKEVFDTKINQVLSYVKSDVVPRAVRKAMSEDT